MKFFASNLATEKNRWYALIFIALGLAIVVIDNTVLNVSIPYMLRDLNASLNAIEWVISGYALTIATLLITFGRLGDLYGRKKTFLIGIIIFAIGSFASSTATTATTIIVGRAIIQAMGAAMTLTSALALIVSTFYGKERAIAFGIWGSIAGASATVGPLLGGYLTTYYSWRWSLRINVFVALVAIIGSIFIKESKGTKGPYFDYLGMILSGAGLFCLVFAFIEVPVYGWLAPIAPFAIFGQAWPLTSISIIPFFFLAAFIFLALFVITEIRLERRGKSPLLTLSMFKSTIFTLGSVILFIMTLGLFGTFFVVPIYLENVLGLNALDTGLALLFTSIGMFIFGISSGFIASRINIKWVSAIGIFMLALGAYLLPRSINVNATIVSLAPGLIPLGIGFGMSSAQLNNMILSSAPVELAGEASGESTTMRQLGVSIGIAIIGAIFAAVLASNISSTILADNAIPSGYKAPIISSLQRVDIVSGQIGTVSTSLPPQVASAVKKDADKSIVDAAQASLTVGFYFTLVAVLLVLFIPTPREKPQAEVTSVESAA